METQGTFEEGLIHTKRLSWITDQIESIQTNLSDVEVQISGIHAYNKDYKELIEPELKAKQKRLKFELKAQIESLVDFVDELKEKRLKSAN